MRKPHRKQLLAWLLTAVLLLTNFPISVLSEEIAENPIQAEATEQDEQGIAEEPIEPTEPPVSEEPDEMPDSGGQSETAEIPTDENNPDIPAQDKSETPEPSDSDIEETPSPEVPEETEAPDADSTDEPSIEDVSAEETPIPEESPLPDDEEAFSVSEAILEYGYAYAAAYPESVIYEDADLTAPLFTLKEDGGVLLITEETETAFKVWWLTYADEPLSGYIAKSDISDISISEETRQTLKEQCPCGFIASDIGYMDAFVLLGELTISEEAPEATPAPEPQAPFLQTGDYAAVTTETCVYLSIDETITEEDNGDGWQGVFTRDAVVSVESVQQDASGRDWCEIRYLYGADDADGKLIWTDTDTLFVPMDDLSPTDAHELTVTDYAYPFEPIALYASADFNLRNHNASVKTFYPGQQGLQGSSGHDSEYKQIAKLDGYGTIYATPHYLEGQTVYCLEHTMNSPGAKDNPTGPFEVVDLDGYAVKPGYSGDIYSSRTMHAIGWVLRHTYPYMIVDTGHEDSDVWSRVAGQFAIREVVKQLEGDWYVRDYWRMDEFYRASGQAPADYLEYARWLASCAIRRSGITGDIVKVLGDNKTDNQHTETPEEGAEFHVYLRKAGSYENAREFERDHLITDKSGYAKTKLLPYGVYVLEQTVGRDGFEIKKPLLFEITGEETPIQPPILTLNDRPILYRLRLIKTDARTGKVITVAGASFKLKDADGNIVAQTIYYPKKQTLDTFTTDESGCVTLPEEVGWGLYSIEEIQAPEGYLIRTESLPVFVGETGDTADQVYELDIEIPNEAVMGQISLEKKGLQLVGFETQTEMGFEYQSPVFEERCLAGAVFEVHAAEDIVGGDGTFWYQKDEWVDTITTSGTGADWSKELPLGKYKLMEIAAPEGYALSDEVYEVELKSIDGHTPLVTVTVKAHNEYLSAEIRLEKEKEILKPYTDENGYTRQELTTTYGLGFVFGLYNADDIHYADGTDNPAPCRSATAHCYR